MVDRNNFPNGVPQTGQDFGFESKARIEDHQRLQIDSFQVGVISGFDCSVVADTIQVNPGSGYTGDEDVGSKIAGATVGSLSAYGSYVKLTAPQTVSPSGGWVAGTTYYVSIVVNAAATVIRPDDDKNLQTVRVDNSHQEAVAEILSLANYNALTDDQKHQRLRVATVACLTTAPGVTVTISSYWQISRVKTCTRTNNVTGVEVAKIVSSTPQGVGNLDYVLTLTPGSPPTYQLRYKSPATGDVYGALVTLTGDGYYTLASGFGYTIKVLVTSSFLNQVASQNDTMTIYDLFEPGVQPASGADRLLRGYQGSGLPTETNPLGLTVGDLGGAGAPTTALEEHRLLQHDAGVIGTALTLKPSITVRRPLDFDYISIIGMTGSEKFFVAGKEYSGIQGSEEPAVGPNTIMFDDHVTDNMTLWEVALNASGKLTRNARLVVQTPVQPNLAGVLPVFLRLTTDFSLGNHQLFYSKTYDYLQFDGGEPVFLRKGASQSYVLHGGVDSDNDILIVYVDRAALNTNSVDKSDTWTVGKPALDTNLNCVLCTVVSFGDQLLGELSPWLTSIALDLTGNNDRRSYGTTGGKDLNRSAQEYLANRTLYEKQFPDFMIPPKKLVSACPVISYGKRLWGANWHGDVILSTTLDLGPNYIYSYRNLVMSAGSKITNSTLPFIVIKVQDTLYLDGGAFSVPGGWASGINPGVGGGGSGGAGGYGSNGNYGGGSGGTIVHSPSGSSNIYGCNGQNGGVESAGAGGSNPYAFGVSFAGGGGGGGWGYRNDKGELGGGGGAAGGSGCHGSVTLSNGLINDCIGGNGVYGSAESNGRGFAEDFYTHHCVGYWNHWWHGAFVVSAMRGWGGGGGGGACFNSDVGGGGGAGGGAIVIEARHIVINTDAYHGNFAFDVRGGNGGQPSGDGGGGGGGGGGTINIVCEDCIDQYGNLVFADYDLSPRLITYCGLAGGAGGGAGSHQGGAGGSGTAFIFMLVEVQE